MSFDKTRNDTISTLMRNSSNVYFKGSVIRAGSFIVDGVTRFVFTIKKDDGETEVFTTAPCQAYFENMLLQSVNTSENLLTALLTYASQVKVGDRVDVLVLASSEAKIIHFIEPEPVSEEEARELDRT